jgi:hypothetical protein
MKEQIDEAYNRITTTKPLGSTTRRAALFPPKKPGSGSPAFSVENHRWVEWNGFITVQLG